MNCLSVAARRVRLERTMVLSGSADADAGFYGLKKVSRWMAKVLFPPTMTLAVEEMSELTWKISVEDCPGPS